ncbi:hypothetical protein LXN10_03950 [Arcobacter sp. KX21116]|jgi:hypothetical protein|uniref:hypothetical protein n=1 Tax=Arcobacter iocasae TaxID=2906515 RepID=UPI0035D4230F|tara:strand:+ start:5873 stop:6097 length:225 start_codon:yes stop_codon:yes gene_type:complete
MNILNIAINVNESSCSSSNTNSLNIQENGNSEFSSMLEKSEKNPISFNETIVDDNETILNQYLANGINFLSINN